MLIEKFFSYDRNKEEGYLIENLYLSTNHKKNKPKKVAQSSVRL